MHGQEFTNRKGCGGVILSSKNTISKNLEVLIDLIGINRLSPQLKALKYQK